MKNYKDLINESPDDHAKQVADALQKNMNITLTKLKSFNWKGSGEMLVNIDLKKAYTINTMLHELNVKIEELQKLKK